MRGQKRDYSRRLAAWPKTDPTENRKAANRTENAKDATNRTENAKDAINRTENAKDAKGKIRERKRKPETKVRLQFFFCAFVFPFASFASSFSV